ncbi:hypothetical protein EJ06DRAFT_559886 [Trichodelitschia bisporula]|uniref:Secreted protein n=1 Tax=Trichodelitschia bisporula TaxID=703511 RepID=A0A6G1HKK7_9PEZI|nr:hypothetical protein EJ06DRAFT_559886 [Trichodelitschia bisporula]
MVTLKIVTFLIGVFAAGGLAIPLDLSLAVPERQCPGWDPEVNKGCVIDGCLHLVCVTNRAICNPSTSGKPGEECFPECNEPRDLPTRSRFKEKGC